MEHHRLKPMKPGYDENLFNDLYQRTTPLRRKLAFQIDARKFGVDHSEILSWFDVKFIHCFNKYFDTEPKRLLGYIINGLTTYKWRIMRSSYQVKYHTHAHMLDVTDLYGKHDIVDDVAENLLREHYLNSLMKFMKETLVDDAVFLFQLQLNPPPFILEQLKELGKKDTSKIPNDIIADYLGYPDSPKLLAYISDLQKDIRIALSMAKDNFKIRKIKVE